ncbi:hypothetical protein MKW94_015404, partial [Papaver nudicaule]|nr:hypothetical protein [Papaver nudicaule]
PVASILGIPVENVFANQLLFGSSGEFVGFDENEPTSRSGGKATAVENLRKSHQYKKMVMIGDGATDLEFSEPRSIILVSSLKSLICYRVQKLSVFVCEKLHSMRNQGSILSK